MNQQWKTIYNKALAEVVVTGVQGGRSGTVLTPKLEASSRAAAENRKARIDAWKASKVVATTLDQLLLAPPDASEDVKDLWTIPMDVRGQECERAAREGWPNDANIQHCPRCADFEPMKLPYYCSPFRKKWNINSSLAQLVRASDC